MALVTPIKTRNGLKFDAAVLVVCSVVDSQNSQYTYQAAQPSPGQNPPIYRAIENDQPHRTSQYQVWIFASEQHLKDGQPPVANLINEQTGAPNHPFKIDGKSALSKIDQAYDDLKVKFPKASDLDVSEYGLK